MTKSNLIETLYSLTDNKHLDMDEIGVCWFALLTHYNCRYKEEIEISEPLIHSGDVEESFLETCNRESMTFKKFEELADDYICFDGLEKAEKISDGIFKTLGNILRPV